jgi:hypothetical protein
MERRASKRKPAKGTPDQSKMHFLPVLAKKKKKKTTLNVTLSATQTHKQHPLTPYNGTSLTSTPNKAFSPTNTAKHVTARPAQGSQESPSASLVEYSSRPIQTSSRHHRLIHEEDDDGDENEHEVIYKEHHGTCLDNVCFA